MCDLSERQAKTMMAGTAPLILFRPVATLGTALAGPLMAVAPLHDGLAVRVFNRPTPRHHVRHRCQIPRNYRPPEQVQDTFTA
ncbi:hypothetical protein M8756_15490 [Lutimaribacter sp. EGI FJ00015]|nr:hypothetical protein [Lutimaribacter sp. EGI FJ00015]MCO0637393.1 hypothetical protein [Lutimaribacter sp. EGI FJ00014]